MQFVGFSFVASAPRARSSSQPCASSSSSDGTTATTLGGLVLDACAVTLRAIGRSAIVRAELLRRLSIVSQRHCPAEWLSLTERGRLEALAVVFGVELPPEEHS